MAYVSKKARLSADALWDYAVKTLAGRSQSSSELRRKLAAKAERAEDVDAVLARLKEYGYLNDRQFAESYAGARLENRGLGKSRVLRDLRARRVAPAVAERAVAKAYSGVDENSLIEQFVDRKILRLRSGALFQDPKELASAYRKLIRAGFTSGNVLRVLKRLAKDPEIVDGFQPPAEEAEPDSDR
ncbi:MAG: regulatory protein RecX [Acidobacteria bacterium]|nr:regulatory protein RecX [Acidobacteriota bacterium]MBI3472637.1 regulatory protein RecX [Candidatus Solibacter usitatus]